MPTEYQCNVNFVDAVLLSEEGGERKCTVLHSSLLVSLAAAAVSVRAMSTAAQKQIFLSAQQRGGHLPRQQHTFGPAHAH